MQRPGQAYKLVNTRNKRTQLFKTTKTWTEKKTKFHNTKFSFHMHTAAKNRLEQEEKKNWEKAA